MIVKSGSARWEGPIRTGKGQVSTQSGALSAQPYGFNTRFEGVAGTNPEELIAAAHAACFSMALSKGLEDAGIAGVTIDTSAKVSLDRDGGGFVIRSSMLSVTVKGEGAPDAIRAAAEIAKAGCPVSRVLSCEVGMDLTIA